MLQGRTCIITEPESLRDVVSQILLSWEGGVICTSEVIDISPGNLDSSLCFFQSSISHDVLCI